MTGPLNLFDLVRISALAGWPSGWDVARTPTLVDLINAAYEYGARTAHAKGYDDGNNDAWEEANDAALAEA
jgi:hypothetical protein